MPAARRSDDRGTVDGAIKKGIRETAVAVGEELESCGSCDAGGGVSRLRAGGDGLIDDSAEVI